MSGDRLRDVLEERAASLEPALGVRDRLDAVDARVARLRRRRTTGRVVGGVAVAAAAVLAVVTIGSLSGTGGGQLGPDLTLPTEQPSETVKPPPLLTGFPLPAVVTVNEVGYEYARSEEGASGERLHRMAVAPDPQPQAIAWATTPGTRGRVVVSLDGDVISRGRAGVIDVGTLLSPRRGHLVVLRLTQPGPKSRIGVAVYHWPQP